MREIQVLKYFHSNRLRFVAGWRSPLKGGRCGFHHHAGIEIVFHLKGSGTTSIEDGPTVSFAPRSIDVYGPSVMHDQVNEGVGEDICVLVTAPTKKLVWMDRSLHISTASAKDVVEDLAWLAAQPPGPDPVLQLACDYRVSALMLRLLHAGTPRETISVPRRTHAQEACAYIREHFAKIDRMQEVADHVGISYDHLRHVFKRDRGMGLNEFLAMVRTERAKSLLLHSRLPIKTIASQCGFKTDRYFSTCFRQAVGLSPGRFRRPGGPHKGGRR